MTRAELLERWRSRLSDWKSVHAQVDGEEIAKQVICDLETLDDPTGEAALTLAQASAEGGVSTRQLARLIQSGQLENVGRKHAPRVRRRDIPRKAAAPVRREAPITSLSVARQAVSSRLNNRG